MSKASRLCKDTLARRQSIVISVLFIALFLGTSVASLAPVAGNDVLIGHADEADLAELARNIAEGKGAVVSNIWILTGGGTDDTSIPHPEPYWSVYLATLVAGFFKLFGASRMTLLVPAIIAKAGIALLSMWWTARLTKNNVFAIMATAVLIFLSPQMLSVIIGKSDIYLTLCMLITTTTICFAVAQEKKLLFLVAGIVLGIGIAVKPSGAIFLGVFVPYLLFFPKKFSILANIATFSIGLLAGLLPLLAYSYSSFGTFVSPGALLVKEGHDIFISTFDFHRAFLDPEPFVFNNNLSLSFFDKSVAFFSYAYNHESKNHGVLPLWLAPFYLLSIFLILAKLHRFKTLRTDPNFLFLLLGILLLIGGIVMATQIVFEPRYWHFLFPFIVIYSVWAITKLYTPLLILPVIAGLASGINWYNDAPKTKKIPRGYAQAIAMLPRDAIVFTSDPWQFSYHTRLGAVMLPYSDQKRHLFALADKYNVGYIVIIQSQIRHAFYQPLLDGEVPEYLEPVFHAKHLIILKFKDA